MFRNGPSNIGSQLFGSSVIVWYVMSLDFLNWILWVRFHVRCWYQSFIDGSNICGVDSCQTLGSRNVPSTIGPQLFGRSTIVWYVMYLDSLKWTIWVIFHVLYWYQSFIDGSNICCINRTDPWDPEMDYPSLGRSYLVVVPSFGMSCASILLTGIYGWDSNSNSKKVYCHKYINIFNIHTYRYFATTGVTEAKNAYWSLNGMWA